MSQSITRSSRYLYCIPPHTHALLRYRVQSVTPSRVAYYADSGVAVDTETGVPLTPRASPVTEVPPEIPSEPPPEVLPGSPQDWRADRTAGPIRWIGQDQVDVRRSWEGVAPDTAVYYSSVETYRALHDWALVRYGLPEEPEVESVGAELTRLRRRMMAAHPDQGGTEEAFTRAREEFEAARRRWFPDP